MNPNRSDFVRMVKHPLKFRLFLLATIAPKKISPLLRRMLSLAAKVKALTLKIDVIEKLERVKKENEKQQKQLETLISKEKHQQQVELLRHQNKITEEKLAHLRELDRKIKQVIIDWRKADDKQDAIKQIQNLLFNRKEQTATNKLAKKIESKYTETTAAIETGSKVKMKKNHQVGEVKEIRGKRALVQIGLLPMSVELNDLVVVEVKAQPAT